MPNPFNTQNVNPNFQLQNLYRLLTQSSNPMQMFQGLAMQNPQMKPVAEMLRNSNPHDVFCYLCKQKGVDPEKFIKSITG